VHINQLYVARICKWTQIWKIASIVRASTGDEYFSQKISAIGSKM